MTKEDLLKVLADEYKQSVRLPGDISLKDCRIRIERETGIKVSDKRAARFLNSHADLISLIVFDEGKVVRIWRKAEKGKKK